MKLALKIDVDTHRGTLDGVPRLVELLRKHNADATFLFSLGPDHTGRAIRRVFRKNFLSKVSRTSVLQHYGLRTLLYGTLLPGPDIGLACGSTLQRVAAARFETGIHCWDHVRWQDCVALGDADWTEREMARALKRYVEIFGQAARTWGAAGWQTNRHAAWVEEQTCDYASDTRGRGPFRPLWDGAAIGCPQIPTTLPTLDEILGVHDDVVLHLLKKTSEPAEHVYTAHAELEGGRLLELFERLLLGWQAQGYELVSMRSIFESLDLDALPKCDVIYGEVPGRSGTLAMQGE
ncbi:MAG TPA: 4-deoxy-4-formamido-L-arabinose-phosphoundecaprenol deformylase [Burkholderiales bacterium]